MGKIYGIDMGSAYSTIACIGHTGAPEIIADNEMGKDNLASAVYFYEDGTVNVGDTAKEVGYENPDRLCQYFRRWLGRSNEPYRERYIVDGREYDPIELTSIVLKHMIRYAWDSGEDVKDVVITIPAYFDRDQVIAVKEACEGAGLNLVSIINEPIAAAINYCAKHSGENQRLLIYDLGGGTCDATLLQTEWDGDNCKIVILHTDGDAYLGGCDWDNELYQLLLAKFEEMYGFEADDELKALIRSQAEDIKRRLTTRAKANTRILYEYENIKLEVTREEFESATAGYVDQTIGWLDSVLDKGNLTDADIDGVIVVGGAAKMPMILAKLSKRFGEKVFCSDPEHDIAKGAAIFAETIRMTDGNLPYHTYFVRDLWQIPDSKADSEVNIDKDIKPVEKTALHGQEENYFIDEELNKTLLEIFDKLFSDSVEDEVKPESKQCDHAEQDDAVKIGFNSDTESDKTFEQISAEIDEVDRVFKAMEKESFPVGEDIDPILSPVSEVEPEKPKKDEEIDYLTYREYIPKDRPIGLKVSVYAIADHRISTVVDFIYPESKPAAPVKDAVLLGSMEIETEYYMSMDDVHISYAENGDVCVRLKGSGAKYRLHVCRDEWKSLRNELHNSRF